jgi:hypothetical protein
MISPAKCRHRNTAINRPLPAIYPLFLAVPRRFLQYGAPAYFEWLKPRPAGIACFAKPARYSTWACKRNMLDMLEL